MDIVQINEQNFLEVSDEDRRLVSKFMDGVYSVLIGWNDIMPVYDKIAYLWTNMSVRKQKEVKTIKGALQNRLVLGDINGVFEFSIQFIQWYNNTQSK